MVILSLILKREYGLFLLGFLVVTAPESWPIYSAIILILNYLSGFVAHSAFRSAERVPTLEVGYKTDNFLDK
jgi:hypothetical protein